MYGREHDLRAVGELLYGHRLLTLVVAGGFGKTRLGQAAAHALRHRWPDGAWIVELAALSDPSLVPAAVAQALGVGLAGERPAIDELVGGLRPQCLLLVLDNCEYPLDAVSALVNAIAGAAPGIRVLMTKLSSAAVVSGSAYRIGRSPYTQAASVGVCFDAIWIDFKDSAVMPNTSGSMATIFQFTELGGGAACPDFGDCAMALPLQSSSVATKVW